MVLVLLTALQALPDLDPAPSVDRARHAVSVPLLGAQSGPWTFGVSAGAQGRLVLPFGYLEDGFVDVVGNLVVVEDHLDYNDLFDPGVGLTLEFSVLFRPPPPRPGGPPWEDTPAMGIYVAFEQDWFGGDEATDDSGLRIEPDDWELTSIFAGFKAQGTVSGPLYGDLRLGLGWAKYPALDGDLTTPGGGITARGEIFEESDGFAFECRMHFGWRLGPLGFTFGFGGRFMDGPDAGASVSLETGPLWTLEFELGAELNF
jgi:hypothetical protein